MEHWHTRTKTGRVPILERMSPRAWLEMNPRDSQKLGLNPHDKIAVMSPRNRVQGVPLHFVETNSNLVTQSAFDPISREPNFKQCAVRVEKMLEGTR